MFAPVPLVEPLTKVFRRGSDLIVPVVLGFFLALMRYAARDGQCFVFFATQANDFFRLGCEQSRLRYVCIQERFCFPLIFG